MYRNRYCCAKNSSDFWSGTNNNEGDRTTETQKNSLDTLPKGDGKSVFLKEIHSQNVNFQYIDTLYLQGRMVSAKNMVYISPQQSPINEFRCSLLKRDVQQIGDCSSGAEHQNDLS